MSSKIGGGVPSEAKYDKNETPDGTVQRVVEKSRHNSTRFQALLDMHMDTPLGNLPDQILEDMSKAVDYAIDELKTYLLAQAEYEREQKRFKESETKLSSNLSELMLKYFHINGYHVKKLSENIAELAFQFDQYITGKSKLFHGQKPISEANISNEMIDIFLGDYAQFQKNDTMMQIKRNELNGLIKIEHTHEQLNTLKLKITEEKKEREVKAKIAMDEQLAKKAMDKVVVKKANDDQSKIVSDTFTALKEEFSRYSNNGITTIAKEKMKIAETVVHGILPVFEEIITKEKSNSVLANYCGAYSVILQGLLRSNNQYEHTWFFKGKNQLGGLLKNAIDKINVLEKGYRYLSEGEDNLKQLRP